MATQYSDLELDALREVANIGSGNAATSLAALVGQDVDISVPVVAAVPLHEAVDAVGRPDLETTAVLIDVIGDIDTLVVLLFGDADAAHLCEALGVEPGTDVGLSALGEVGNIVGAAYLGAIGMMTGMHLEPAPPQMVRDMLGAIVSSILAIGAVDSDTAILLDSRMVIGDHESSFGFIFLINPGESGIGELLRRLGIG